MTEPLKTQPVSYKQFDTEDFFCDAGGTIGGEATVDVEWSRGDYGETVCYVTLISLRINGLTLTADQIADAFGSKRVVDYEETLAEDLMEADA